MPLKIKIQMKVFLKLKEVINKSNVLPTNDIYQKNLKCIIN